MSGRRRSEGRPAAAVLLGLALRCATQNPVSLARAGFEGTPIEAGVALFEAILERTSGTVFAVDTWEDVLGRIGTPDGKVQLALDDLLADLGSLVEGPPEADAEFPFVLSAGERRSFTANTIFRDARWRQPQIRRPALHALSTRWAAMAVRRQQPWLQ